MKIKSQKAISIPSLLIIVCILIMISIIILYCIKLRINQEKVSDIHTNMYTINTYAIECLNSNLHKNVPLCGEQIEENLENFDILDSEKVYTLTDDISNKMNISINTDNYYIIYDFDNKKTDVIVKSGLNLNDKIYYRLSKIEELEN